MKLSQIKPNPKNPRVIKDDKFLKLVNSLREFPEMMAKRPMVCVTDVDGKLYPLGGNMRLKALTELQYKDIPDSWVSIADDWTVEQRNEFTIKDNLSFGEWDFEQLANEWDSEELGNWGLDMPSFDEIKEAYEDMSDSIKTGFRIEVVLSDEKTQELLYNELISRNYECRILTL